MDKLKHPTVRREYTGIRKLPQLWESVRKNRLAAVALGGNQPSPEGDSAATLVAALRAISQDIGGIVSVSRFFRTPAYPPGSGPDFVNAAALVATDLDASAMLSGLHAIEARFARKRDLRWGARTLDLDLVAFGDAVLPDPATEEHWRTLPPARQSVETPDRLILPHPRLQDRAFVLIPLAEIAPGWRHPVTGRSVAKMLEALPEADKAAICPI
ncbi:2-amino-4-hydroxy-6-hydroxymethyldihydropteridine diphosphokinase [Defluviimonas sp. SAOS-178_SWC]|uniref:2-amino-4-hydroxy-6- hydroxymethyldihydropteridine diphosphokinase n=1 Tax=Defluviimonas sp. SAOS-178_SWC TaxID=3121287 RepID=UPI003221736E